MDRFGIDDNTETINTETILISPEKGHRNGPYNLRTEWYTKISRRFVLFV